MRNLVRRPRWAFVAVLFLLAPWARSRADEFNWPQWRGPSGDGHSAEKGLPLEWDARAIAWRTPLRGRGQSTPVVWGERVFLTFAVDAGRTRLVTCVDRRSGKVLWEKEAWTGTPEPSHAQNGWATATCATDGERVVAFFGKGGLHCYSVEGEPLWSRDLGSFPGEWGTAASPVIVGDLVIQNCDAAGVGSLVAVNKKDGKDAWKAPRTAPERGGWTTPVLVDVGGGKKELVVNGEKAVTSYDPLTGTQLWSCKSFAGRGDPTVTPGNGLVFVVNGVPGDIYAVRPGGTGDVTKSRMAWHTPRKSGRDEPSPILVGDYLVVASMGGITTCYKAGDGSELWTERLNGTFSSSPVAVDGKALFQNEAGETYVIEPGPKFKLVTQNTLGAKGEVFRASLTPCAGQIFTRSDKAIYCVGKK
jgi:outer membrane protein assembly factor BamB